MTQKIEWDMFGYRAVVDRAWPGLCHSSGIWPIQWIKLGAGFFSLPRALQAAAIVHEVGHLKRHHLAKRLAALPLALVSPGRFNAFMFEQEYEADRYAAERGHGLPLVALLRAARLEEKDRPPFYPRPEWRIERIEAFLRSKGA